MASPTISLCTSPIQGGPVATAVTTLLQGLIALQCALTTPSVWPADFGPTALADGLDTYDFVVVGGGTSGSVIASRLSENPAWKVLVIDAGENPPSESEVPALFLSLHRGTDYTENYYTEATNDRACQGGTSQTCYWPIAKVLGGTSSIDHMASFRGNKEKFDGWGLTNWGWSDVLKYYELAERYTSTVANPNGRLVVNEFDQYDTCFVGEMIFQGAEELGVRRVSNLRGNERIAYGYMKGHIENGQRMGAGKTYFSPVKSRTNIQVIKKAVAQKINFEADGSVKSVSFVYEGNELEVLVDKEVILAAGVIGNPKLLMLSGIGPQAVLDNVNIVPRKVLEGVGQNLQDQLGVPVPFQQKKGIAHSKTADEKQVDWFYYLTQRYGPLTTTGLLSLFGFINSDPSCAYKNCRYPDLTIHHLFSQRNDDALAQWANSIDLSAAITQSLTDANKDGNMLLNFISLQNPASRGYVTLQTDNYLDPVNLVANYLEDDADEESLLQGIRFQMELEKTNAYKKGKAEIIKLNIPECEQYTFKSDDYWRCYIKYMTVTIYAPAGTTKMGVTTDSMAVVDTRLNLIDVPGVRVVGRSVFPTTITATDPSVMTAERLAVFLREDWL